MLNVKAVVLKAGDGVSEVHLCSNFLRKDQSWLFLNSFVILLKID